MGYKMPGSAALETWERHAGKQIQQPGSIQHYRCNSVLQTKRIVKRWAASNADGEDHTLNSLDALLGSVADRKLQDSDAQLVPWWKIKPKQSAPPRQALMQSSSQMGKFVAADHALPVTRLRSGKSTIIGQELDLPQVEPYFCYMVMAMQLAVYAAGTWLAVSQGELAAEQFAMALALQPEAVQNDGESWRMVTCLLLHGQLTHLAVDTFFLGWSGPGIEALLGHSVFTYIYLLSGLAGSAAVLLLSNSVDPVAGATAASVGLVGAMVGYELRNQQIVKQTLDSRRSKADNGKAGSSALRKPFGAIGIVCLMLGLGFIPGSMVNNAAHLGGLLAGVGLGFTLGPNFTLVQEVHIPEGSMSVPEDAQETVVVLDRRSGWERVLAGAGAAGLVAGLVVAGTVFRHASGVY